MRIGVMLVVCGLAACETRNGTYFVVDGEQAQISFDQLEFFLGRDAGMTTPYTPMHPYLVNSNPVPERQRLTKRLFEESDVQTTPETRSLSYYLPADDANTYANYALVVASRGGVVVGLGEVEEYKVFGDAAYIYDVPLVPVDNGFERWGTPDSVADACVRWSRHRHGEDILSTYVVSRDRDRDCDGATEVADCDDLNYCATPGDPSCMVRETSCITSSCDLGSCTDGTGTNSAKSCAATTCLPDEFCVQGDACREAGPSDDFLACAVQIPITHTEVKLPLKAFDGGLCMPSAEVSPPFGLLCVMPKIESPPFGQISGWTFAVTASPTRPERCMFTLTGPTPEAPPLADAHVVVSVEIPSTPPRRTTFVVGFAPLTAPPFDCSGDPEVTPPSSGSKPICP